MHEDVKCFPAQERLWGVCCSVFPARIQRADTAVTHCFVEHFHALHFGRLADVITAAARASHSQIGAFNGSGVGVALSAS